MEWDETEVLFSILVKTFEFSSADIQIEWHLGTTMAPFEVGTGEGAKHPSMPLNVRIL